MRNFISAIVSGIMGFFSGVIVLFMGLILSKIFVDIEKKIENQTTIGLIFFIVLVIAWFLSSYLLNYQNNSLSKTFARGFLLWASEWLIMVFVTFVSVIFDLIGSEKGDNLSSLMNIIAGGTTILMSVGFCFLMSAGCMIGYSISVFFPREMKPNIEN